MSVRARFSAAAEGYSCAADIQKHVAGRLAEMMRGLAPDSVLDAGCGTGILTRELCALFPRADVAAVDFSERMIERARGERAQYPQVSWAIADLRNFAPGRRYSLIASSCSLHWVKPLGGVFGNFRELLEPDGRLVFGMMLDGTLGELWSARAATAPGKGTGASLPPAGAVLERLGAGGWKVVASDTEEKVMYYPGVEAMMEVLHRQGVTGGFLGNGNGRLTRRELERLVAHYDAVYRDSHGVRATYVVLYVMAKFE